MLQHGNDQYKGNEIIQFEDEDDQLPQHDQPSQDDDDQPLQDDDQPSQYNDGGKKHLSVELHLASQQTGIPTLVLKHMWSKAAELLLNNQVVLAPGCPSSSRMVASTSNPKPYLVSCSKDGRYECDETCPNFLQRYICPHSVAAAKSNGQLKKFVENYAKFTKTSKGQQIISLILQDYQ